MSDANDAARNDQEAYVRAQERDDEITALRAEVERLRAALVTARGDLYNAANAWNDEDYRGPVPGGEGDFAAHSVASQKKLVDWICSRAEAISAELEKKP